MGADDGETLRGFRAGCDITLALTGADIVEIIDHVGWTRRHTAHCYRQLAKVLNPSSASARLASDEVSEVINPWQDVKEPKRFACVFRTEQSSKRALSD